MSCKNVITFTLFVTCLVFEIVLFSSIDVSTFCYPQVNVREYYFRELLDIAQAGHYMGFWQIHALASVLKAPIYSMSNDAALISAFNNRTFTPRNVVSGGLDISILWCFSVDPSGKESRHFVPVVPDDEDSDDAAPSGHGHQAGSSTPVQCSSTQFSVADDISVIGSQ